MQQYMKAEVHQYSCSNETFNRKRIIDVTCLWNMTIKKTSSEVNAVIRN